MPELPEVETIRRGLAPRVEGRRILVCWRSGHPLRKASPLPLDMLEGRRVMALRRHAKVLFWDLDDGTLVSHLGMTGKFLIDAEPEPSHTHLRMHLDDGTRITFSDPRRFGWLALHGRDDPPREVAHYGPDALSADATVQHLRMALARSRAPLKSFLLDQTKLAGIGNIYACEALWRCRLSPRRLACNTPRSRIPALLAAIQDVLQDSLAAGGTSFNAYVDSIGKQGSFLFDVAVFHREGEPCPRCGPLHPVRRISQSGRSTFYCPGCQR